MIPSNCKVGWKFLCACDLLCQDARCFHRASLAWETMLIFERATQLSALTFIQAHRFLSIFRIVPPLFVSNAAPATSQSKSNPTSNPITWNQISSNLNPKKINEKKQHQMSKNSLKIKNHNHNKGNQSKSNQSQPSPIRPNPLPNQSPKSTSK